MQTDIWLTEEISYPERCPLCSVPLKKGSTTCLSCGFSTHPPAGSSVWIDPAIYGHHLSSSQQHPSQAIQQTGMRDPRSLSQPRRQPNPITPIPPRASAQPANAAPGSFVRTKQGNIQKRHEQRETSRLQGDFSAPLDAQRNPTVWEYESSDFQAASSLQALSLMISEAPTQPELTSRGKATHRLPRIDEIDTTPVLNEAGSIESSKALVPLTPQFGVTPSGGYGETTINVQSFDESNSSSWTAGEGSQSPYARLISSRSKRKNPHNAISLNAIDRVRWWLLRPRRIEFVLWLGGTILLVGVTCILLLVAAFSFEWLVPGFISASTTNMTGNSPASRQQSTVTTAGEMKVTLTETGPLLPGQSIHLHGQGFSPHGHISFLFDGKQPLLDQNGKYDSTQADARGVFTTTLRLSDNPPLLSGSHFIDVQDLNTKRTVKLPISLAPGPIGKGVSSTPVPSSSPVVTPTPIPGGQPTPVPVGQTPVPTTPTPHPGTPTVTPTVGITPTVTPTVGKTPTTTPTVTPTAGGTPAATPTVTPTVGTTIGLTPTTSPAATGNPIILGSALYHSGDPSLSKQLTHLSPWVWLMMACYSLSMVLLGLAGVLHKRRR